MFVLPWLARLVEGLQVCVQPSLAHTPSSAAPNSCSRSLSCSAVDSRPYKQIWDPICWAVATFWRGCAVSLGTAGVSSGSPATRLVFGSSCGLVSSKGAGCTPLFLPPPLKLPNLSSTPEPAAVSTGAASRGRFVSSHLVQAQRETGCELPLLLPTCEPTSTTRALICMARVSLPTAHLQRFG